MRSSRRTGGCWKRSPRWRIACGGGTSRSSDEAAVRVLRRADPRRRGVRAALRSLVARRAARPTRSCSTFPRALLLGDDADVGGRPQAWKQGDLTLPLSYRVRSGLARGRRHGARAAARAAAAARGRLRMAGAGAAARARDEPAARAAEGGAAPAGADARDRRGGARGRCEPRREPLRRGDVARARAPCAACASPRARGTCRGWSRTCGCASRSRTTAGGCWPRARTSTRCARQVRPQLRAELSSAVGRRRSATACGRGRPATSRGSSRCRARATRCAAIRRWSTKGRRSASAVMETRSGAGRGDGARARGGC